MKIVVVVSGGLDSTTLLATLVKDGHEVLPVNFSYGSRHNEHERKALLNLMPSIRALSKNPKSVHSVKLIDLDLSFLTSSLLKKDDSEEIPEGHYEEENMKSTVVPFRNGIMMAYAISIAEEMNFDNVALGNHSGDHAIYPDCRTSFVKAMHDAGVEGTYNNIGIVTPFTDFTKSDIVETGQHYGLEDIMAGTWSCYKGDEIHCGKCGTCVERQEAFFDGETVDKTPYTFIDPKFVIEEK